MPGPVTLLIGDAAATQRFVLAAITAVEDELSTWDGLSGRSIRFAYAAVQRIRPSFIDDNIDRLLPDLARIVDPSVARGIREGSVASEVMADATPIAQRSMALIDRSAAMTANRAVLLIVERLRPMGHQMIERLVPTLAEVLELHVDPPPPPRAASLADFLALDPPTQVPPHE